MLRNTIQQIAADSLLPKKVGQVDGQKQKYRDHQHIGPGVVLGDEPGGFQQQKAYKAAAEGADKAVDPRMEGFFRGGLHTDDSGNTGVKGVLPMQQDGRHQTEQHRDAGLDHPKARLIPPIHGHAPHLQRYNI